MSNGFYGFSFNRQNTTRIVGRGGIITYADGMKMHKFLASDSFFLPKGTNIEILLVGGGGGGSRDAGGGGGAGGVLYTTTYCPPGTHTVTIGPGGDPYVSGVNSVFRDLIAYGGGRGGYYNAVAGAPGGSGGGAGWGSSTGGQGVVGQGKNGSNTSMGGGGGAAEAAHDNNGGMGLYYTFGSETFPVGGGGAAPYGYGTQGGGNGQGATPYVEGTANTGGGGGGGIYGNYSLALAKAGGSGICIIRYASSTPIQAPVYSPSMDAWLANTTSDPLFTPASIAGLQAWYDCSSLVLGATTVVDQATNRTTTFSGCSVIQNEVDNKSMLLIQNTNYVSFTSVNVRTAIICENFIEGYFLSDSVNYNFDSSYPPILSTGSSHINARNGAWRVNGKSVNPIAETRKRGNISIVSCVTATGTLSQNRFGYDRTYNIGYRALAEVLIWDTVLTTDQVATVERYLARKWKVLEYGK